MPGIKLLPGPSSNHTYIRDYHMAMAKRRLFDDTLKLIAVSTWRRHQIKQLQGISVSTPKGFGSGVAKWIREWSGQKEELPYKFDGLSHHLPSQTPFFIFLIISMPHALLIIHACAHFNAGLILM